MGEQGNIIMGVYKLYAKFSVRLGGKGWGGRENTVTVLRTHINGLLSVELQSVLPCNNAFVSSGNDNRRH